MSEAAPTTAAEPAAIPAPAGVAAPAVAPAAAPATEAAAPPDAAAAAAQGDAEKAAQAAADLAKEQEISDRITATQAAAVAALNTEWIEAMKTDKEIGGEKLAENLSLAKAAMEAVASPKLIEMLAKTGLGNNPEVVRMFLKVGPAFAPDKFVPGGKPPGSEKTAAQILYPNQS